MNDIKRKGGPKKPGYVGEYDPVSGAPIKKVRWYHKLWVWMNGKKMLFGGLVLTAGLIVGGPWGIALKAVGGSFTAVGGIHKIGKKSKKYGKPGEFGKDNLLTVLVDLWDVLKRLGVVLKRMKGGSK